MDSNNWRPNPPGGEPALDTGDWRAQLQADSRSRIVNKIMETLKRHLPFSGQEGLNELRKIAVRFEEKIYTAATSQSDYLRKISLKMLTMETKSQTNIANSLPSNSEANTGKPPDPGSLGMPSQVHNQAQSLPIPFSANQPQARQQLLSLDIQNNITPGSVQSSSGLPSSLPQASNLTQTSLPNVGQNSYMQSLSGVSQNLVGNSMGQGIPSNMFANSQSQMQGRQQVPPQQAQQQSQNPQQYLYQQQIHQQIKLQQGNLPQSMRQSHIQQQQQMQQQQQKLAPPTKLPWSEQSDMQTISVMEPSNVLLARLPDLQQQQLMQIVRKYSNDMSEKTDEHSVFVLDHQLKNPLQQELVIKKTSAVPEASSNMMPHLPGCLFLFLLFLWLYACYA